MNIYLNEYNLLMGLQEATYLPLVSGILQATAQSNDLIAANHNFMPFIFSLDAPADVLSFYNAEPDVACDTTLST